MKIRSIANIRIITYFIIAFFLTGCSTYPSRFICSESEGTPCVMLSDIDKTFNQDKNDN